MKAFELLAIQAEAQISFSVPGTRMSKAASVGGLKGHPNGPS